jgi:hypothetical protein
MIVIRDLDLYIIVAILNLRWENIIGFVLEVEVCTFAFIGGVLAQKSYLGCILDRKFCTSLDAR